jgi:hypothetical protein
VLKSFKRLQKALKRSKTIRNVLKSYRNSYKDLEKKNSGSSRKLQKISEASNNILRVPENSKGSIKFWTVPIFKNVTEKYI